MDEFAKLYLDNLEEERRNRISEVQDNKCFLALLGYINKRLSQTK